MRMSNYLCVACQHRAVMAATEPTFGIQHLTVVPVNFEPSVDDEPEMHPKTDAEQ